MVYNMLSLKTGPVLIRFRCIFLHMFQFWKSPGNFFTFKEFDFLVIAFNYLLRLHLCDLNHEEKYQFWKIFTSKETFSTLRERS